jgi:hypothetical protein
VIQYPRPNLTRKQAAEQGVVGQCSNPPCRMQFITLPEKLQPCVRCGGRVERFFFNLDDGHGNLFFGGCAECGGQLHIKRPGDTQCNECGK